MADGASRHQGGGSSLNEQEDALARVLALMRELERVLIEIKEAVIPVLVGSDEPIETAWRARTFLRLADRCSRTCTT